MQRGVWGEKLFIIIKNNLYAAKLSNVVIVYYCKNNQYIAYKLNYLLFKR